MAAEGKEAALRQVWLALGHLRSNESFHAALDCDDARAAVRHWSGEKRLPAEECEEWGQNPRLMMVLRELRQLQHACQLAGIKVPLNSVLAKSDVVDFPDGSKLIEGKLVLKPEEQAPVDADEPATIEEKLAKEDREADRCRSVAWTRQKAQLKWQLAAGLVAVAAARLALWWNPEPDPDDWAAVANATAELVGAALADGT
eukprot:CAMPEP_0176251472 /NCGR_PEP_ID=MMETSP0121_2-20121125/35016_1 /TAXON_ID=160619 /ORGANISM="Kryptoperidinium foliaceum, Strain CCMP 1326" /LENGTH=200 /DNA_ID=CAMNT_0017591215 /DNA_START=18 /DNA_END=620 /DNA_ORIENTATION=+